MTSACIIIPARYASSRFPGKPLVKLLDKPMILWICEISAKSVGINHVYVATDSQEISQVVNNSGFKTIMTSSDALTGTDRVAEASLMIDYDIYINVQGDEPLVSFIDINKSIALKKANPSKIINGYTYLSESEDVHSVNIPKVITNEADDLIYISRQPLPGYKSDFNKPKRWKKQVCIYGFNKNDLKAFRAFARKSVLESFEDIEILRFLELDKKILMYECQRGSLAVDIPDDVKPVEDALRERIY